MGEFQIMKRLNDYRDEIHAAMAQWWVDIETKKRLDRNVGELVALIHSEASESLEGHRKNLDDDHCPGLKNDVVELADVLIRCFDFAGGFRLDLDQWSGPVTSIGQSLPGTWDCWDTLSGVLDVPDNFGEAITRLHTVVGMIYVEHNRPMSATFVCATIAYTIMICQKFGMSIDEAFTAKMVYNGIREDHTHEHRRGEHGKKF